jgi:hypothetical protein
MIFGNTYLHSVTHIMGIDYVVCESIFQSFKYVTSKKRLLTLGRQGIHIGAHTFNHFLKKHNVSHLVDKYQYNSYCELFFTDMGFETVDSIDNSSYEGATIIHNMNNPIPAHSKNRYDYIFDGGTTEHIFNTAQVCENIINLLNVGGIYVSVTPNNNFSGHGIYQFSPEFYLSAFSKKYGMAVQELYLAKLGSDIDTWMDVNVDNTKLDPNWGGRNVSSFNSNDPVYIVAIMKKISNDGVNLIANSPNQFSYEQIDWKNN